MLKHGRDREGGDRGEVKRVISCHVADYICLKSGRLGAVGRGVGAGRLHSRSGLCIGDMRAQRYRPASQSPGV